MTSEVELGLQHLVKELLHRAGVVDRDRFAQRLADSFAAYIQEGIDPDPALMRAFRSTPTQTFRSRSIRRQDFESELVGEMTERELGRVTVDGTGHEGSPTRSLLIDFAKFAESRLSRALKSNRSEEFLRSSLLAWLDTFGETDREPHEGAGQLDISFRARGWRTPETIEVKVPRSKTEFDDGLTEVAQYAQTMRNEEAFYVVADHCADLNAPGVMTDPVQVFVVNGIQVIAIRIRISAAAPSQVGKERRKRAREAHDTDIDS